MGKKVASHKNRDGSAQTHDCMVREYTIQMLRQTRYPKTLLTGSPERGVFSGTMITNREKSRENKYRQIAYCFAMETFLGSCLGAQCEHYKLP